MKIKKRHQVKLWLKMARVDINCRLSVVGKNKKIIYIDVLMFERHSSKNARAQDDVDDKYIGCTRYYKSFFG